MPFIADENSLLKVIKIKALLSNNRFNKYVILICNCLYIIIPKKKKK